MRRECELQVQNERRGEVKKESGYLTPLNLYTKHTEDSPGIAEDCYARKLQSLLLSERTIRAPLVVPTLAL